MASPQALFGLINEIIILLLGLLLAFLALTGRFAWNLRREFWIVLAVALCLLGMRTVLRAGKYSTRWLHLVRGASFVIVGVIMLVVLVAPLAHMQTLLTAAGVVLALRGLLGAVLALRAP